MLRKLMKHEWKSVSKIGSIILLTILAVTLMGCIFLNSSAVVRLFTEEGSGYDMQMFGATFMLVVSLFAYILLLCGALYGIMAYLGVHFYKTMYTDQGYLVHTLPVTPNQILLSKTLISGVWMLLINTMLMLSMFALIMSFVMSIAKASQPDLDWGIVWQEIRNIFQLMLASNPDIKGDMITLLVVAIFALLISPFFSMIMLFGALTIGQLSKKYKVLMSILTYIGLMIVYSIVGNIASMAMGVAGARVDSITDNVVFSIYSSTYGTVLVLMVLVSILLYCISHYIVSRKLNMD